VDSRLAFVNGRRLSRLRKQDLPEVAVALIAWSNPGSRVGVRVVKNTKFVRLSGRNFDVAILNEDWEKIAPLVKEGVFTSYLTFMGPPGVSLNPEVADDSALVKTHQSQRYQHVLGILETLFPESYPTSNL
jgi:hypothetical protein